MFKLSTDISRKDRKVATLQDFKGLDTVHSPLNITYSHAIGMRNLINRDGANRKRKGWRQARAFDASGIPAGSWSGEIDFSADKDGSDKRNVFIHFYYLNSSLEIKAYDLADNSEITVEKDFSIFEPMQKDLSIVFFETKLYIAGCGDILVGEGYTTEEGVLKISVKDLSHSGEIYIPETILLGGNELNIEGLQDSMPLSFSQWVYLIAGYCSTDNYYAPEDITEDGTQSTDGEALTSVRLDGILPFTLGIDQVKQIVQNQVQEDINILSSKVINNAYLTLTTEDRSLAENKKLKVVAFRLDQMNAYNISWWDGTTSPTKRDLYFNNRKLYMQNISVEVYINYKKVKTIQGFVQQKADTYPSYAVFTPDPSVDGYDDIRVAFVGKNFCVDITKLAQTTDAEDYNVNFKIIFERRITESEKEVLRKTKKAEMLTLFGEEGNPNRLMFSDRSNVLFYSEYRNPLYIGGENTITLGSTPITAWIKGTETSLYVFKKFSRQEENLYVIDPQLVTSSSNAYNVNKGEVLYLNKGYSVPESAVNQYCACNLANDILIVSDDGVYGIEMSANVASTERFARSRAEQIKNLLQEEDLTSAKAIVWDNKMFIAVNGNVYIADARYRATFNGDMSDTFNYEWWFWDNMPVYYWIIINEKLCFVTKDNRICEFYDGFADYILDNVTVANIEGSNITISKDFVEYNRIKWDDAYKLALGAEDIVSITQNGIISNKSYLLGEGMEVYFDMLSGSALYYPFTVGEAYTVSNVDVYEGKIEFISKDGSTLAFTNSMQRYFALNKFRISRKATDLFYIKITDQEEDNATIYETKQDYEDDKNPITFINYNSKTNYTGNVYKWKTVIAEWKTGSYDFGSSLNAKSIERFSVSFDRSSSKKLKLYYTTANMGFPNLIKDLKKQNDFDLTNLNFLLFSFDQKFETSYTKNVLIRNFNYISFMLVSDDEEDFSINSIGFVYKINRINRGEL